MNIEEEFKSRLREAKEDGKLEETAYGLCYEVGRAHGSRDKDFTDVGWKDVIEWKQEVQQSGE